MIDDPSGASDQPRDPEVHADPATSAEAEVYMPAREPLEPPAAGEAAGAQAGAIDALRAATTAADAPAPQLSFDHVSEIERLHETRVDAEKRARRAFAKPGARRRLQEALTEETNALFTLGFATFDEFAAAQSSTPSADERRGGSAETIARICEMLNEIGIDPGDDPIEVARAFLETHEGAGALAPSTDPLVIVRSNTIETWAKPPIAETAAADTPPEVAPPDAPPAAVIPDTPSGEPGIGTEITLDAEPDAPWVPAAQIPTPPPRETGDDEVVDRWIHAEARAERMHSEVDRAQAELASLLARSAQLEQTVVERVDERDNAHAELEQARTRVAELEQAIARSSTERAEIERALATSRDRIAELEGVVVLREEAYVAVAREREIALDTAIALEASLAARIAELEQARVTVAELEAQLMTQAVHLDETRGELGTARASADELRADLETTRRSLDALDEHAESIEAELADARRKADSSDTRRELDGVRQELAVARAELGELEARRTESDATLSRDRAELEQLQRELMTTRDATDNVRSELNAARSAFEATNAHIEAAEHARDAITIDAADLLARAEAESAGLLERAHRDAEAIRQDALLASGSPRMAGSDDSPALVARVAQLERKVAKQRRRLDRIVAAQAQSTASQVPGATGAPEPEATDVAPSEREAVRRAVRQDRERFRDELVDLLSRLTPLDDGE